VRHELPGCWRVDAAWSAYRRTEQARAEAAEEERAAFVRWQESYGAYEIERDEASAAWAVWVEAIVP
jgi:cation transport regulator ChaB